MEQERNVMGKKGEEQEQFNFGDKFDEQKDDMGDEISNKNARESNEQASVHKSNNPSEAGGP
jgi:hypothetical protein